MDQRASLLDQLRIDRDEPVDAGNRSRSLKVWIGGGAVAAVAALGGALWLISPPPQSAPISVAAAAPVAAAEIQAARGGSMLDASGYVVARRQATVSSKVTGKVVAVLIEEGQRVAADEIVARLDDTNVRAQVAQARAQLAQQHANLNAAQVAFDNAGPTFARNEAQFVHAFISAQTFDSAKATFDVVRMGLDVAARGIDVAEANLALAERNLDDTVVRAPFAGVVTVKAAQEGEMVSPISAGGGFTRTGIGTIVDMGSLEVEVDVSENFINRVQARQRVSIVLNAYPDVPLDGRVIAIIPTADRAKATVKVRVGFDALDERILPQMGARVSFLAEPAVTDGAELANTDNKP